MQTCHGDQLYSTCIHVHSNTITPLKCKSKGRSVGWRLVRQQASNTLSTNLSVYLNDPAASQSGCHWQRYYFEPALYNILVNVRVQYCIHVCTCSIQLVLRVAVINTLQPATTHSFMGACIHAHNCTYMYNVHVHVRAHVYVCMIQNVDIDTLQMTYHLS